LRKQRVLFQDQLKKSQEQREAIEKMQLEDDMFSSETDEE
jgi:hypothetical protein